MYGYDVKRVDDPCVAAADEVVHTMAPLFLPGGTFLNTFPVLRHVPTWVPGTVAMRKIKHGKALTEKMINIPMNKLKKDMVRRRFNGHAHVASIEI